MVECKCGPDRRPGHFLYDGLILADGGEPGYGPYYYVACWSCGKCGDGYWRVNRDVVAELVEPDD